MVLNVQASSARLMARPSAPRPKSPLGLCGGLGTSQMWASKPLASKRSTLACVNWKSGTYTSPASTQNTSASSGKARAMPPAVSSA